MALVLAGSSSTTPNQTPLIDAVREGNEELISSLLSTGHADVRETNEDGQTALHIAVLGNRQSLIRLLVEKGANLEASTKDGSKPLYIAAREGSLSLVETLLAFNAQAESFNLNTQTTAFYQAIEEDHKDIAKVLLDHGANIDFRLPTGRTALLSAVIRRDLGLVEFLLRHGANKRLLNDDGILEELAKGDELDQKTLNMLQTAQLVQGPSINAPGTAPESRFTHVPSLPATENEENRLRACHVFEANIVDFFIGEREERVQVSASVFDILYGIGPEATMGKAKGSKIGATRPNFRWYHLPANNMVWVEALVSRLVAERKSGAAMLDDNLKSSLGLSNASGRQYRASTAHSSYMRPLCRAVKSGPDCSFGDSTTDHMMLFMPFLHYEIHHAYEEMSSIISEVKHLLGKSSGFPPTSAGKAKRARMSRFSRGNTQSHKSATLSDSEEDYRETKKPIRFRDCVGRKFSFPFDVVATWAGMENIIKEAFAHIDVLGPRVAQGQYDLIGPQGEIILPQVWESIIQPDWVVTMLMWPLTTPPEPSKRKGNNNKLRPFPPDQPLPGPPGASAHPPRLSRSRTGPLGIPVPPPPSRTRSYPNPPLPHRVGGGPIPPLPPRAGPGPSSGPPAAAPAVISMISKPKKSHKAKNERPKDRAGILTWMAGTKAKSEEGGVEAPSPSGAGPLPPPALAPTSPPSVTLPSPPEPQSDPEPTRTVRSSNEHAPLSNPDVSLPHPPNTGQSKTQASEDDHITLVNASTTAKPKGSSKTTKTVAFGQEIQGPSTSTTGKSRKKNRKGKQRAKTRAESPSYLEEKPTSKDYPDKDLIMGYLFPTNPGEIHPLQPRRTLDQYFYTHLESTSQRDADQVVYRYTAESKEPKIFMVDQLWLWILNEGKQTVDIFTSKLTRICLDIVISCFPQRWQSELPQDSRPKGKKYETKPEGAPFRPRRDKVPRDGNSVPESSALPMSSNSQTPISVPTNPTLSPSTGLPWQLDGNTYTSHKTEHAKESSDDDDRSAKSRSSFKENEKQEESRSTGDDEMDVLQRILTYLKGSARAPITSVYGLADLIANSCASVFDQYSVSGAFQFLEFFERSIGNIIDKESRCLQKFTDSLNDENVILDIRKETALLVEIKDISDELDILQIILDDQKTTMKSMEELTQKLINGATTVATNKVETQSLEHNRVLDSHIYRIQKMKKMTQNSYQGLQHLLDLKQKQANFSEALSARKQAESTFHQADLMRQQADRSLEQARLAAEQARLTAEQTRLTTEQVQELNTQTKLAREQADEMARQGEETTRQGKTILMFTVVTIIFLPLSFLAAFFAINLDAFPADKDGNLPIGFVLKYMLTISAALSIPFILVAFQQERLSLWLKKVPWNSVAKLLVWIGAIAVVVVPLVLVWTRPLAQAIKTAVTVAMVLIVAVCGAAWAMHRLVSAVRNRVRDGTSVSYTDSGTEASLVDD
ncbi:hypothetical protein VTL71DRAFT_5348 [Oculimacula yallundae]|uniref:Ubiquitin-like domain-containing protein n=1 Tax=Oculimacula yallundae TaxID=86028 RepID=A0ABR4C0T2_9HELO